jgi:3-phosphoshikimate 1-carboxyvinyltransferase
LGAVKRTVKRARALTGEVRPPPDKSISHRAAICNSIARGEALVRNYSPAGDCASTLACLKALGVDISLDSEGSLLVRGRGGQGLVEAEDVLDAGNSGTTMRLLTGLLAAQPFLSVISGDASLRSRPMGRVVEPLRLMGASIWGRCGATRAPLVINGGSLRGITYKLPVASAQLKSALLLAGLSADGDTVVEEPVRSRDHTERMLASMGARIRVTDGTIILSPGELSAIDVAVPGDISAAAFWLVAGAIHTDARIRLPDTGVNPTRSGIIDVLRSMGARVAVTNERTVSGEPMADIEVNSAPLRGMEVGGEIVPRLIDEIPLIALAGSLAQGKTVIRDAQELRVKETDRIRATVSELAKMGAAIEEMPDGMVIQGGRKLHGAECSSHGDHRLAMMLGVAALVAEGETRIDGAEAADISYPAFWGDLGRVSAA